MDDDVPVLAAGKVLAYLEQVRHLHEETHGERLESYKNAEPECLASEFRALLETHSRGLDFVAELVHRLCWAQCLENGNHRTTLLFLAAFLQNEGIDWPPEALHEDAPTLVQRIDVWAIRSKTLLGQRGKPTSSQARLRPEHHDAAKKWVTGELAGQSDALAMIGPQRLITFISRSES